MRCGVSPRPNQSRALSIDSLVSELLPPVLLLRSCSPAPPAPPHRRCDGAGKNKTNLSSKGSRIKPESRTDDLVAHLKEFEEWANPAFNVLIVQTPRPKFFESPILKAFRGTINETGVSRILHACMHACMQRRRRGPTAASSPFP